MKVTRHSNRVDLDEKPLKECIEILNDLAIKHSPDSIVNFTSHYEGDTRLYVEWQSDETEDEVKRREQMESLQKAHRKHQYELLKAEFEDKS